MFSEIGHVYFIIARLYNSIVLTAIILSYDYIIILSDDHDIILSYDIMIILSYYRNNGICQYTELILGCYSSTYFY